MNKFNMEPGDIILISNPTNGILFRGRIEYIDLITRLMEIKPIITKYTERENDGKTVRFEMDGIEQSIEEGRCVLLKGHK